MLFPLNILHGTLWDAVDTHRPTQRCMIYQLNKGNNGKSSFLNILHKIMGEYYTAVDKSVFIKIRNNNRQANAHTSHLIPIIGKRAIASSELTEGDELNMEILKMITGKDEIRLRDCGEKKSIAYTSCAKPIIITNTLPTFNVEDSAAMNSMCII